VISGAAEPERARRAMESATRFLVDDMDRLVRLFTPPFDRSQPSPGYIMGYPPGLRENGGQYTHGSLWLAMARARMGEGEVAVHLLKMMSPVELSRGPEDVGRYRGEPYVLSADVSDAPGRAGRSGWTWYSGSAGWMYRIWIEEVLGFQLSGDRLSLNPVIPDEWPGFELSYRYRSSIYEIAVVRNAAGSAKELEVDGALVADGVIRLAADGLTHSATLRIPWRSASGLPRPAIRPAVPISAQAEQSNGASTSKSGPEKVPQTTGHP
jgi:cyclic beta-1,2-glucan synthetase